MFGLTPREERIFKKLATPERIQDYLDTVPINFEKQGDTHYSPRRMLAEGKAHCIEGAAFAAAVLWHQGARPLLLDLRTIPGMDDDHVVALYRTNGYWGAIGKTNHAVLGWRDPIYNTVRELALSYFHEYYLSKNGKKTLAEYSRPLDMRRFGTAWVTVEEDLWFLDDALNALPHYPLVPKKNAHHIRRATRYERRVTDVRAWEKDNPRT